MKPRGLVSFFLPTSTGAPAWMKTPGAGTDWIRAMTTVQLRLLPDNRPSLDPAEQPELSTFGSSGTFSPPANRFSCFSLKTRKIATFFRQHFLNSLSSCLFNLGEVKQGTVLHKLISWQESFSAISFCSVSGNYAAFRKEQDCSIYIG